jgi:hypothetical protein
MTRRVVAVRVTSPLDAQSLDAAMLEDVVDLVAGMEQVEGALLAVGPALESAQRAAWPNMQVLCVIDVDKLDAAACATSVHVVGADEVVVVCADAPDLPPLLLGKLFSALTTADVAVCPAEDGRLIALATQLPPPDWLDASRVDLDDDDALLRLREAAPSRRLVVGSGWHRTRTPADAMRLDPGLEGWEATRAWLASRPGS